MTQDSRFFPFAGGLDVVTPAIAKDPGRLIASGNYSPDLGGYRRIVGYERFDGHPSPSEATYHILNFNTGENEPPEDATVAGLTSGAHGVIVDIIIESGSWATNDAQGYFVIRILFGAFEDTEQIVISEPVAFSSGFSVGFE